VWSSADPGELLAAQHVDDACYTDAALENDEAGIGIGIVAGNAIQAMARQPEAAATARATMFLGIAFTEALALFGFVLFFLAKS